MYLPVENLVGISQTRPVRRWLGMLVCHEARWKNWAISAISPFSTSIDSPESR